MSHPYIYIVVVMVLTGIAGGSLAHLLRDYEAADSQASSRRDWITAAMAGLIASFMVPLFLNTISSNLVDSIMGTRDTPANPSKLFIFSGFCLVAAVSSKAFISTLSAKVLREVRATRKEVRQVKSEVEPIIEKETEKESSTAKSSPVSNANSLGLGMDEQSVLRALADGKFALRTRTSVAAETGIPKLSVDKIVDSLKARGLVNSVKILRDGKPVTRWHVTGDGRSVTGSLGK